ncbi:MAG: NAD(P)H-quinone oxidoreductase subunit L [Limnoraphis robusta]|jgi:NAD(P)H-quinone oxidoreductase subunit L|uniref:NAD(P)H-quinone oxidoreductase subunit L n=2 Tax=Limnoraphis robusta TaxID=1118279 RepID=A0A0F5YGD3_9CYAN|nr:NAD(P)H-quinone oxidoreductase subunit L [Limnoraphis robusta]MCG5060594.1 NAD(P)H-quinone oxidoreductase subunit L [Limnoraphis sp. WC205]KKD37692.1 NAD(P)H-quinone oxidoreductase [Limnoraphis robusta CS-951]KMW70156.1 NAD(P)H-quinone oxidoreductase [Limnoraphis robusta CS-951]MEA5495832.1 NAD(P)H-quinone oxidoreductase subunit L [Limnoraphis robusta BA-68 BA1]MEA5519165.1 NAD(P)H-quinone oxidoreductase subunit L [Limnoraphis robusta CCNP1315]
MSITSPIAITLILYVALAGAYLLVVPAAVYAYLNSRWYVASSFERAFMYFLMFFFLPGMIVLAPFLNFRPKARQIEN